MIVFRDGFTAGESIEINRCPVLMSEHFEMTTVPYARLMNLTVNPDLMLHYHILNYDFILIFN